jgi:trehalose 6-phosphate phosphatase
MTEKRPNGPPLRLADYEAGVFDLDGVVTDTASLHRTSWKDMFDAFLAARGAAHRPFTDEDYYRFVDGRPRYEGVRIFLESRGLDLPYGDPDDSPERETVCGLGNRKNEAFNRRLGAGGVEVFDNSVRLIAMIKTHGLKTALVTSSRNAEAVLAAADVKPLFDAIVDGNEAARQNLRGKPHPDTYRHALEVLGVEPARAFGVEDATSGVQSIRAAGYRLVVGVDRADQRQALLDHGADIVVRDLGELRFTADDAAEPDLPDALDRFDDLSKLFAERKPAIFLDYDGTLTPIVSRPELAVLDEAMRATLAELADVFPTAIISGRDRANVEGLVGLARTGLRRQPRLRHRRPRRPQARIRGCGEIRSGPRRGRDAAERERLEGIEGVIVERKRYAIAVHYRLVAEDQAPAVEQAFDAVLGEVEGSCAAPPARRCSRCARNWSGTRARRSCGCSASSASTAPTSCRSTSATTRPTRTRSKPSPGTASASWSPTAPRGRTPNSAWSRQTRSVSSCAGSSPRCNTQPPQ